MLLCILFIVHLFIFSFSVLDNFHNTRWQTFSQTDQKKLPCLAANVWQESENKISSVLENPFISIILQNEMFS